MAELLKCLICGYETVRCGMHNHMKSKHPLDYIGQPLDKITKSLGKITCEELKRRREET